jgi:hypothetical protein
LLLATQQMQEMFEQHQVVSAQPCAKPCQFAVSCRNVAGGQRFFDVHRWESTSQLGGPYSTIGTVIATFPDGLAWNSQTADASHVFEALAWSGSLYVAVGEGGAVQTSSDASTWQLQNAASTYDLLGVAWERDVFVAVGRAGTIITSSDATAWTTRASGVTVDLTSVTWTGVQFVAVGENGTILTSNDGSDWQQASVQTTTDFAAVAPGPNHVATVGLSSGIALGTP